MLFFISPSVYIQNLSRALVNIASKLTNTKDVRDLFIDLVEKVLDIPNCRLMHYYISHG